MNNNLKYILIGLVAVIAVVLGIVIYRMFFQFDSKEISEYANDEAVKYKDRDAAYSLIMDGVEYILGSHNLTQQVLRSARATGTDKEQELVTAAIQQCKLFNYIPA